MLKCLIWTEESTGVGELPEEGGAADNFLEALDGPKVSAHSDLNLSNRELCIL